MIGSCRDRPALKIGSVHCAMAEATSRFRSGESGGWAKKFTKEQSAAMDALYAERVSVEAPGLQFDFGENPYEPQEQDQKGSITM